MCKNVKVQVRPRETIAAGGVQGWGASWPCHESQQEPRGTATHRVEDEHGHLRPGEGWAGQARQNAIISMAHPALKQARSLHLSGAQGSGDGKAPAHIFDDDALHLGHVAGADPVLGGAALEGLRGSRGEGARQGFRTAFQRQPLHACRAARARRCVDA